MSDTRWMGIGQTRSVAREMTLATTRPKKIQARKIDCTMNGSVTRWNRNILRTFCSRGRLKRIFSKELGRPTTASCKSLSIIDNDRQCYTKLPILFKQYRDRSTELCSLMDSKRNLEVIVQEGKQLSHKLILEERQIRIDMVSQKEEELSRIDNFRIKVEAEAVVKLSKYETISDLRPLLEYQLLHMYPELPRTSNRFERFINEHVLPRQDNPLLSPFTDMSEDTMMSALEELKSTLEQQ